MQRNAYPYPAVVHVGGVRYFHQTFVLVGAVIIAMALLLAAVFANEADEYAERIVNLQAEVASLRASANVK